MKVQDWGGLYHAVQVALAPLGVSDPTLVDVIVTLIKYDRRVQDDREQIKLMASYWRAGSGFGRFRSVTAEARRNAGLVDRG